MTRLEWTNPAVTDLEHIHDYVARDSAEYANALIARLILSVERLKPFPKSGRHVPEAPSTTVGELMVAGYRVIYRMRKEQVQILSVVHRARNPASMKPDPWDAA